MYIILYSIIVLSILIITIDGETCPMRGDIRYDSSGGTLQGALQVCEFPTGNTSLQWLYVCNNNWDSGFHESDTWCRQLGYVDGSDGGDKTNIINSGEYKLTNVDCNQNDMRIIDCNYNLDNSECEYEKDVACTNCDNNNQCDTPGTCNTTTGRCECIGECMNGGYCYFGVCVCPANFTGSLCEDCNPACQNNGACNSSGVCVCPYGYNGSTCETVSTTLMTTTSTTATQTTISTETITATPITNTTQSITTTTPNITTAITTPNITNAITTPNITTAITTPNITTVITTPNITTVITTPNITTVITTINITTVITTPNITTVITTINITQQSTTLVPEEEEVNTMMGLIIGLTFVVVLFIIFCILAAVSAMVLLFIYRRLLLKKTKGTLNEPTLDNLLYRINTENSILTDQTDNSFNTNGKYTHIGIEITHQLPVNEDDIYSNIDEYTDDNAEQIYETYINEVYVAFSESEDRNQDIYGIYEQISDPNEKEAIVLNSNQREEQSFLGLSETIKQHEYKVIKVSTPYVTNTNANAANNSIVVNSFNVEAKSKEIYTEPPKSLRKLFDTLSSKKCREINPALLKMEKEVGSGAFGVVYKATWDSNYGLISVAVKQLKHSTEVHKIGIMQEAAIMRQFNHPNVLSLIGVVSLEEPYMIVTELMKGELKDILLKMKESQIDEFKFPPILLKFTREIAEGMKHLSERGFIHRDLAARNVLVTRDLTCRIADFGMSRQLTEDDEYYKSTGGQIPLRWTAPEAVWYRRFSLSSDVWSFGMTMFEIWSLGMKPWLEYTPKQIIEAYSNEQIHLPPTGCPKEVYRIMIKACNYEPEIRPNFIQICQMLRQPVALLLKRKVTSNAADKLGNDPQLAGQF